MYTNSTNTEGLEESYGRVHAQDYTDERVTGTGLLSTGTEET